ncbi:kinase-associated lipoprotein B [Ectobacillus ponti]|uniref:Kinase-associated lipoprotein B n=1 Tax=Ectobacillus ponti TaxID=2961894 RepID=A0AA41X6F1_9BACI|nr:kinase-associated lipoprotein B [Ectobacillus ponti]MCP8969809.1 kinase-associated lipoprotein B [Ectobacillus ponti]
MEELQIGSTVTGIYKTGKYIGEVTAVRPEHYLVKVLAVLKHPTQGDLHHVKEADVPFFQERRALAFREQTNVPKQMVKPYDGEVPDYKESLRTALHKQMQDLTENGTPWAERSLQCLRALEQDYRL